MPEVVVTGFGVTSAIGQGKAAFGQALFDGAHAFGVLRREGRQLPASSNDAAAPAFIGAEIDHLQVPDNLSRRLLRTASWSAQVALATLHEAWHDARLDDVDPQRIGLVVGGSNFQQRELMLARDSVGERPYFLKPSYGHGFMDTDLCGLCTEVFDIRGFAYTLGGASASGQVAVLQALQAVQSDQVDVCIALGALMDLSYWELQALRSMGAMGSERHAEDPAAACRPFDTGRDGFIYGEGCAAVVLERANRIGRREVTRHARCLGSAMAMDGNRNPNPSLEGEIRVMRAALAASGLSAGDIDYLNPHGTASRVGDEIELQAIRECGLDHVHLNATKSITGHGLSAAGTVEIVATLLQMQQQRLHPTRNLHAPIDDSFHWVRDTPREAGIRNALTMSIGFGGVNSALCLQRI